jgi:hypothetical protein
MWSDCSERRYLENAFSILRFRRRGVVSFRRFVVLSGRPGQTANDMHLGDAATQPMRVMRH